MGTSSKSLIGLALIIVIAATIAIPWGFNYLVSSLDPMDISVEEPDIAADLQKYFRLDMPAGYKGGFSMNVSFFGIDAMTVVAMIPEHAEPLEIFEGGSGINYNPGEYTIAFGVRSHFDGTTQETFQDLRRIAQGEDQQDRPMERVFIKAGGREIAAYEYRTREYGQDNLNYFIFLDGAGMIVIEGPETGFDHEFKEAFAAEIAKAYPANDLLYTHVEPPQRDPNHPCGFRDLPESFQIQAVGIRGGSVELDGRAIDPDDADAGMQEVAVGETDRPVVLILMSGEPTVWQVMSTPDARIAGVIASGRGVQRIIGLDDAVQQKEMNTKDRNSCAEFLTHEAEGSGYDRFSDNVWEVFARGVRQMHTRHGGDYFRIGQMTDEPTPRGHLSLDDVLLDGSVVLLPGKLGIAQLLEDGVLRPARTADLDTWIAEHKTETTAADAMRRSIGMQINRSNAYVVTRATDLPSDMAGANSSLFIVLGDVPAPGGGPGHNTLLLADGRCVGPSCPR